MYKISYLQKIYEWINSLNHFERVDQIKTIYTELILINLHYY